MHVCFITHEYPKKNFPHGGVGTFVKNLTQKFNEMNVRVSIVGTNYETKDEFTVEEGIEIYRVKKHRIRGFSWMLNSMAINRCVKQIHAKNPIDIIEATELGLAFIIKIPSVKYIIRMHGGHHFFAESENRGINFWKGFQEKLSFKKADAFIAVSNFVGNKTRESLKMEFSFETIYNSVDVSKFAPSQKDQIEPDTILFIGTICEKKGVRQLVLAMSEILLNSPNAKLKIVGRDWFFPNGISYIAYLKTFIADDIKHAVEILGAVDHHMIAQLIDEAEICVLPSHMEAMPLAWLEALSKGKPFVGSDIGPGHEAVQNMKTGLLANPNDPSDIAKKVCWMLNNKGEASKMGAEARKSILSKFNSDAIFEQNINFYKTLAK